MSGDRRSGISRLARSTLVATLLVLLAGMPAAGSVLIDIDPLDELEILAVRDGQPADVLFAAPARMMTQTLTGPDVIASVDGEPQPVRLRRLAASDIEVAVVVDTTLSPDELRSLQGAIVELALDLPQGATMRIVGADGTSTPPAAVPGPAIAQIRRLSAETDGDMQQAVTAAAAQLDDSSRDRTALLIIGRDLDQQLDPVDDQPLTRTTYVVNIGGGSGAGLLGPQAAGTVIAVDDVSGVLAGTDQMSQDLRNLYLAEVPVPDADAGTLTLQIPAAGPEAPGRTVALDPDSIRPVEVDPAGAAQADAQPDDAAQAGAQPDGGGEAPTGDDAQAGPGWSLRDVVLPAALAGAALIALGLLWLLFRGVRRWRRRRAVRPVPTFDPSPAARASQATAADDATRPAPPAATTGTTATPPTGSTATPPTGSTATPPIAGTDDPRPRRPSGVGEPQPRPIAKLSAQTREALARAHLGLRRLALASRNAADSVPDHLFRLSEAVASVALSGPRVDLETVLVAALAPDEAHDPVGLVQRTATALSTGWQHTARRRSAPPPVIEINAVLTGRAPNSVRRGPQRPVAPVRALNPLVEIGLEHILLAARPGDDSALVARAVTAVDMMRAARLARPALAISPWLLTEAEHYHACLAADLNDPWQRDEWLELLCTSVARGAAESADRMTRLDRLRSRYRDRTADARVLPLVDLLLAHPVIDTDLVMRRLSTSKENARLLLSTVVESGWIEPHGQRPDTWVADQVLALFTKGASAREHTSQSA